MVAAMIQLLDTGQMPFSADYYGLSYTPSQGDYALRGAIAESISAPGKLRPEDVFITEGVTGGLFTLGLLFAFANQNPDSCLPKSNRFLLPRPVYPPWVGILKLFGLQVATVGRIRDGVSIGDLDPEELEREMALNHRAIVLISADNPTSRFLREDTAVHAALLLQRQMRQTSRLAYLIIDDIYGEVIPKERRIDYFALSEEFGVPLIYLSGIDKTLGTGLRGGHLIPYFPDAVASHRDEFLSRINTVFAMTLGVNRLTQAAALTYFRQYEQVTAEILGNLAEFQRRSEVYQRELALAGGPLTYRYGPPELPYYHAHPIAGADSERFTLELLNQHGICVGPGQPFEEKDIFRVAMMRDPVEPVNVARIMQKFAAEFIAAL
jgi:aspartate/methionine/tyrosine aminotransferase